MADGEPPGDRYLTPAEIAGWPRADCAHKDRHAPLRENLKRHGVWYGTTGSWLAAAGRSAASRCR